MSNSLHAALLFLINTVFDLYLFVLVVRIVLVYVRSNYFEPVTQFVVKLTDFLVTPLRRIIPNIGRFETASIILLLVLELIKFLLISSLSIGIPNILGLFILAFADAIKIILTTFFYAIILQAIISWFQPYSPVGRVLNQFTAPIMQPLRRIIPTVGGIDITPIPAIILIQLTIMLLVDPLMVLGVSVALK